MNSENTNNSEKNFWKKLPVPFFALAPMADVTDIAFRHIIAKYSRHGSERGGPDVFFTEFVSADGIASRGRNALLADLSFDPKERPVVAQLFTGNPDNMLIAARVVSDLGFDGIDINMGCPDRTIEKQGAGAALMKDFGRAKDIIAAAKEGARGIPVSVKTRLGYNTNILDVWLPALLETKPAAITVHARTRKELSLVPARWEEVARAVCIARGSGAVIIGNGDVSDVADARTKTSETGAHGAMLGRAVFGNPWLFDEKREKDGVSFEEKIAAMVEHTNYFEKTLGDIKSFSIMKKHYKAYANGFAGAKELRTRLMEANDAQEVERIAHDFLENARTKNS